MRYAIGFDCGATKTLCEISTVQGEIIGRGEAGPSNYHVVGIKKAQAAILKAVENASVSKRLGLIEFDVACFGVAGLDSPRDRMVIVEFIEELGLAKKNIVVHDSLIALYGATIGKPGIVLIAGTGSVAAGKNKDGIFVRTGNWGHIIGDEGSAYDIGRRALMAAVRAYDWRGPETALVESIKNKLNLELIEEIMDKVYTNPLSPTEIASLAPLVSDAAKSGDKVALRILRYASRELANTTIAAIRKLKMEDDEFIIGIVGGVFKSGQIILRLLKKKISPVAPKAHITYPRYEPVRGAVIMALNDLDGNVTETTFTSNI